VTQFEDEVTRGEVVTRQLMDARRPYALYFRFPFNHTGDTAEKKAALEHFLAEHGYRTTPHTIENSDYIFNVPYVRARTSGDAAMRQRLADAYVDFTLAATTFAERISPAIFGREIPQTLLIHANDINADALERLLVALEARGYRFITLDEAMADPAYKTPDTLVTTFGPTWLWRWAKSKGTNISFNDDPDPPAWVAALSQM
jgi:peptidoglycan/xylan/chitin deacetylase (PgdA/CDA1 family)